MSRNGRQILLVTHAFLPQSVAGTEMHAYHLARHLSAAGPVCLFHAARDASKPDGSLQRAEVGGIQVWRFIQNYPYRQLDLHVDSTARRALSTVLDTVAPALVHFHHLANLSLDLPLETQRRGLPSVFTLHDYYMICPSGGQLAAHPDGGVCEQVTPARCARCFEAWRSREGRLEHLALRLSRLSPAILPAGWPFHLFQQLPTPLKAAIKGLNRPSPPIAAAGGPVSRRLDATRRALEAVNLVISPSVDLLERFRRMGFALPNGRHVPNGVPDPWAPPGKDTARPPLQGPAQQSPVQLVHIGTLTPHKGIDLLVEAAASLDPAQAQLRIYGSTATAPAYVRQLLKVAERSGVIRFMGPCAPEEVAAIMASAHALVLAPRWPENAPLTVLEARGAGLPVIAPRIGGLPETVHDQIDGLLVPPEDAEALGAALTAFVTDATLRARLRAGVRPPLTAAAHAALTTRLYDDLLGPGP